VSQGWQIHVVPFQDRRTHLPSFECWCEPKVVEGIIVHAAADNREKFEEGKPPTITGQA
jgi:hypothetical protein